MRSIRGILIANAVRHAYAAARQSGWAQQSVATVGVLLLATVITMACLGFWQAFLHLLNDDIAGPLVVKYLVESSLLLVFALGVASFVATSVRTLFRSRETDRLAPFPIEARDVFLYRFTVAALVASWPVLLLAMPAIMALGMATRSGPSYYAAGLLVLAVFPAFIAVCGGVLSFFVAVVSRHVPKPVILLAWCAVALGAVAAVARTLAAPFRSEMFDVPDASAATARFEALRDLFAFAPSHPFAEMLAAALPGATSEATVIIAALAAAVSFAAAVLALDVLVRMRYASLLQRYRESTFVARPDDVEPRARHRSFPHVMRWGHSFLFEKDLLVLLRDPGELARGGAMLLIMVTYVLVIRAVATVVGSDAASQALIVSGAFFVIGYFAVTLGMRFVFPSPSAEGKVAWLLWNSPVHNHEFHSWKSFFWTAVALAFALLTSLLTVAAFSLPFPVAAFFVFALCCTAVTVVAVTLGQGSMHPRPDGTDPDALATSPSGLAATAMCLVYVWILARYMHAFVLAYSAKGTVGSMPFFGVLIMTIAIVGAYAVIVPRVMDQLEFPG